MSVHAPSGEQTILPWNHKCGRPNSRKKDSNRMFDPAASLKQLRFRPEDIVRKEGPSRGSRAQK